MKTFPLFFFACLIIHGCMKGQVPNDLKVEDEAFDQEIKSLLSFTVPNLSVHELEQIQGEVQILDAREKEEYDISRIPGALHIGYNKWDKSKIKELDKSKPVVVYCSVGYRSEKIAEKLQKNGFAECYNLYGSIFEWANQNKPLIDKDGNTTHKVHTYDKKWSQWVLNEDIEKVY